MYLVLYSLYCLLYSSRSLYYSPKQEGLLPVTMNASRKVVEKKFQVFDCSRLSNHSSPSEPLFPGGASLKSWNFGVSCCSKKNQNAPRPSESVFVVFFTVIYVVANPVRGHKEVPRSTGHIMVTTRYSDQQGSKWRQQVMRLYKRWHRPITKRFIKPPLLHIESSLD